MCIGGLRNEAGKLEGEGSTRILSQLARILVKVRGVKESARAIHAIQHEPETQSEEP
jgi:hypothetical protein